ncbi:hypothetical protein MSMTP_1677 [Methanosarcina sp. MTP4]|uniref:hypothetical protein n=1 Tax=Methanosarcina sp. MTP4 TaxID=1434100 RepID=UPI00061571B6|nr:hypothetical protein [Methanosarcina sp. MTP4]AKB25146.1 hypothetical protein MSMTP_1677 [Methanosarcina sp. MTP4]
MGIFSKSASSELKAFLETEDLDDLVKARERVQHLDENDIKKIRSILEKWDKPQEVSNLLFHPSLIPEDIRFSSLLKGLEERDNLYYLLASIAGLQGMEEEFSEEEKIIIKEHLISALEITGGVLAARASVTIVGFLSIGDANRMFKFLSHPEEVVRLNILSWLIETLEETDVETFALMLQSSEVPEDIQADTIEKFREHLRKKESGETDFSTMPLYAYIPNLNEVLKRA